MPEKTLIEQYNARLGIWLFLLYLLFYVGFVLINAFRADWMDAVVFAGLNLAVVYGFALIVVAIVMSFIYGVCCKVEPRGSQSPTDDATTSEARS